MAALTAILAITGTGCASGVYAPSPGDPEKPARACLAVDEATPLAMSPADRVQCERTMRGWYAETRYPHPDPADRYEGDAQLAYLRAEALWCRRAANAYRLTGQVPVPEYGVSRLDAHRVDGALGELEFASSGHISLPDNP